MNAHTVSGHRLRLVAAAAISGWDVDWPSVAVGIDFAATTSTHVRAAKKSGPAARLWPVASMAARV
jgi:hypothetical protein